MVPSLLLKSKLKEFYRAIKLYGWPNIHGGRTSVAYSILYKMINLCLSTSQRCIASYCIAQNFGGRKLWRIWRLTTNPPKFYPPKTFILTTLLCKAANPPMFFPPKCLLAAIRQKFSTTKVLCHTVCVFVW